MSSAASTKARPKRKVKKVVRRQAPNVRTSERSSFTTCLQQWEWGYNQRLTPIRERPALKFGTMVHAALEARYPKGIKRGPKPAETFEKLYDADVKDAADNWGFRADEDEEWVNAKELGISMLENYVATYDRDEDWEVIASEMTFKVPVYSPPHPDGGFTNLRGERVPKRVVLFYYVGTMDGVWKNRMDGGVRVNDYKTTKNDPTKEGPSKGVLDEQSTAYWTWGVDYLIAKKVLKPRHVEALDGMLFTFLYKAKKDERPVDAAGHSLNKDGSVSQRQPVPRFHRELVYRSEADRAAARYRAEQEVIEMALRRSGALPIRKSPKTGALGHCSWCSFRDMCELHEVGADWEALRDATMQQWDPYAAHEIKEEGKR